MYFIDPFGVSITIDPDDSSVVLYLLVDTRMLSDESNAFADASTRLPMTIVFASDSVPV